VVDLFFEEFYEELERVVEGLSKRGEPKPLPAVVRLLRERWHPYIPRQVEGGRTLIAVDGGVQSSAFAYGGFVSVGRACALIYGEEGRIVKRVRIYIGAVYEQADREAISRYVRMIAEYTAAREAAERVLREGGSPLLLLDGSLLPLGIPKRPREYLHHWELLIELFDAIASLHSLAHREDFPLTAVAKDSTATNLHSVLLRMIAEARGLDAVVEELRAATPHRLRRLLRRLRAEEMGDLAGPPLCDTALVREATRDEGYTTPLLLAPPPLWRGAAGLQGLEEKAAEEAGSALKRLLSQPGVASTYFRSQPEARPMRVDILASLVDHPEPWGTYEADGFVEEGCDLSGLEKILNHLGYWFCNEVEYNLPLHQADLIAGFDRNLYESRYEPLIISRLEEAGVDVAGRRRVLRR
jgi:hypothetical protein